MTALSPILALLLAAPALAQDADPATEPAAEAAAATPAAPAEIPPLEDAEPAEPRGLGAAESYKAYAPIYTLWARGGAGRVGDLDFSGSQAGYMALGAGYWFGDFLRAEISFSDRFYAQEYLSVTPDFDGQGLQQIRSKEQLQDLQLGVSFDLFDVVDALEAVSKHTRFELQLAPRWLHFANPVFGT